VIAQLQRLFLFLVAPSLVVRPVPVALATVPDWVTTNDEWPSHQLEVNVARLARRRAQDHTGDTARWIELDLETATRSLGDDWRRLVEMLEAPPTGGPMWQRVYWRAFQVPGPGPRVHALRVGDELTAVIPLRRTGRFIRRWLSGANAHTPYWAPALGPSPQAAGRALEHLMASVHMLDFGPLYVRRAETEALVQAARERELRVAPDAHGSDAVLDLPASSAELRRSLGAKLVGNISRRRRHLAQLGRLEFEVVITGGTALQQVLAECFTLETIGWKGQRGAPISSRPDTLQFYSDLAEAAAAAGQLALHTLRLNSTLIAFEYCLRHNGRLDLLKESYHPEFARYSPGNILRFHILQSEIESGAARTYHLGMVSEWKARWATRSEPLCRLRIYDTSFRGTLSYLIKSWIPGRARQQAVLLRSAWRRLLGRWRAA